MYCRDAGNVIFSYVVTFEEGMMQRSFNYKSSFCLAFACAAVVAGCNHRVEPQPTNLGQPAVNSPVAAPAADNQDKCHFDGKIITCEKGVCDPATGNCVDCLASSDCKSPEKPICSEKANAM